MEEGWKGNDGAQVGPMYRWHTSLNAECAIYLSGLDACIKLRPNEKELKELGPEFSQRWKDYFADKPDKPVMWVLENM